jgi:hypothetical protein
MPARPKAAPAIQCASGVRSLWLLQITSPMLPCHLPPASMALHMYRAPLAATTSIAMMASHPQASPSGITHLILLLTKTWLQRARARRARDSPKQHTHLPHHAQHHDASILADQTTYRTDKDETAANWLLTCWRSTPHSSMHQCHDYTVRFRPLPNDRSCNNRHLQQQRICIYWLGWQQPASAQVQHTTCTCTTSASGINTALHICYCTVSPILTARSQRPRHAASAHPTGPSSLCTTTTTYCCTTSHLCVH